MKLIQVGGEHVAKVDEGDFERLTKFSWRFDGRYAYCLVDGRKVYMHEMLCQANLVDHDDRDKLNNQRANLKSSNQQLNQFDRKTRNAGVSLHLGSWDAYITLNGLKIHLGRYSSREDAEVAREAALTHVVKKLGEAPSASRQSPAEPSD